jgi:hypothetical protein
MPVEREDKILAIDLAASALCSQWGKQVAAAGTMIKDQAMR